MAIRIIPCMVLELESFYGEAFYQVLVIKVPKLFVVDYEPEFVCNVVVEASQGIGSTHIHVEILHCSADIKFVFLALLASLDSRYLNLHPLSLAKDSVLCFLVESFSPFHQLF